jgi:hypothetical protein
MQKILVISNNDLMFSGVVRMLGNAFHVISQQITPKGEKDLLHRIQSTIYEAVIVDLSLITSSEIQIDKLLEVKKDMRLLLMHVHSNELLLYDKQEIRLENNEDLRFLLERPKSLNDQLLSCRSLSPSD